MNLSIEDKQLLKELCEKQGVSQVKVLKLLEAIQEYEFKERRAGVYDKLKKILKQPE